MLSFGIKKELVKKSFVENNYYNLETLVDWVNIFILFKICLGTQNHDLPKGFFDDYFGYKSLLI